MKEAQWKVTENINDMRKDMARHIWRVSKYILEESKETDSQIRKLGGGMKTSKAIIKAKRTS